MYWTFLISTVNNSLGVLLWLSKIKLLSWIYPLVLDFGGCQFTGSTFFPDVLKMNRLVLLGLYVLPNLIHLMLFPHN